MPLGFPKVASSCKFKLVLGLRTTNSENVVWIAMMQVVVILTFKLPSSRAYVQRCNDPPVHNLISIGGQHMGKINRVHIILKKSENSIELVFQKPVSIHNRYI